MEPTPAAPGLSVNAEGVPLGALAGGGSSAGILTDCRVKLADRKAYEAAAAAAETALYGKPVQQLGSEGQLDAVLAQQPPLLLGVNFWVLEAGGPAATTGTALPSTVSNASDTLLGDAINRQLAVVNAAFSRARLQLRLEGVVHVELNSSTTACTLDSPPMRLLTSSPLGAMLDVVICEVGDTHGATRVLEGSSSSSSSSGDSSSVDGGEGSMGNGLILLRMDALLRSRTSLVHQLGHFWGLPHPFPDTQTCRVDGDGVGDTVRQHTPHMGCPSQPEQLSLCPEALDGRLAASPVHNFMELTNDTCRCAGCPPPPRHAFQWCSGSGSYLSTWRSEGWGGVPQPCLVPSLAAAAVAAHH